MDGWRRREIGISGGGSLRRPSPNQGCSAEKKKKKKMVMMMMMMMMMMILQNRIYLLSVPFHVSVNSNSLEVTVENGYF